MIIKEIKLQEGLSETSLTAYLQDAVFHQQNLGGMPAVIVCPGGAYLGYTEKEAEPVALKFLSEGFQVFVLRYSIGDTARFPAPFLDVAKAVMLVREHAKQWNIHPDQITLCGFSTGAQVAAALGAMWQETYLSQALNADKNQFKPNALILGYPVLDLELFSELNRDKSQEMNTVLEMMFQCIYGTATPTKVEIMEWDLRSRINSTFPPTFMWTTAEDSLIDVEQYLDFIKEFSSHNIRYEFHIFEKGSHGSSMGNRMTGFSKEEIVKLGNTPKWVQLAMQWLREATS